MTSPSMCDPQVVAIAGDWHGNLLWAETQIRRAAEAGADVLVHVGDFGLWPGPVGKRFLLRVDRALARAEMDLMFVDGNHDDHDRIASKKIDLVTGLRSFTPRVHHVPRGHRWRWSDQCWMGLGGAVSVDKHRRHEGRDWWPTEVLSAADVDRACSPGEVDVLIAHDAPAGVKIPGLRSAKWPDAVIAEADAHRSVVRTVVDAVRPRTMWHGHYHVRYRQTLAFRSDGSDRDEGGGCVVQGLDCDDGRWADNLVFVAADGALLPIDRTRR